MKSITGGRWLAARLTVVLVAVAGLVAVMAGAAPTLAQEGSTVESGEERAETENADNPEQAPAEPSGDFSHLADKAEREGSVRVKVGLRTDFVPEGRLSQTQRANQRNEIESAQSRLRIALDGTGYQPVRQFDTVPAIALEVSPRALEAIRLSPVVTSVVEDRPVPAPPVESTDMTRAVSDGMNLAESTEIVQAPDMWDAGFTGRGQVIAILDTGVDSSHSFLSGKVVEEACYSVTEDCPNGSTVETGPGTGVYCQFASKGCEHGTHVAGIAAGKGITQSGVAKDANIMSVRIASRETGAFCNDVNEDPCVAYHASDQLAGLRRVYELRNEHDFAAVNMSGSNGPKGGYSDRCDSEYQNSAAPGLPQMIANLKSVGIATVASSGNGGYLDGMNAPACVSNAVSVGATTRSDTLWDPPPLEDPLDRRGSNSASFLSLLAPGSGVGSSVPGGGFVAKSGTSMAAPHVAGAWALLKQKYPRASVDSIRWSLQGSGTLVTDTRRSLEYPTGTGITKPRINIADAATNLNPVEVTNTNDSGGGSLRQAITEANDNAKADIIEIGATGTVDLQTALPELTADIEIVGPGADQLTVKRSEASGTPEFRIFTVGDEATASISGLNITNGIETECGSFAYYEGEGCGGGIANFGDLSVNNSTIEGNTGGYGGGIANIDGNLSVKYSDISGNDGWGGIYNGHGDKLTVTGSTIRGNDGGGIVNNGGDLTITGSTVTENTAIGHGGGITNFPYDATAVVADSTITENTVEHSGSGGICNYGTLTVEDSTVSGNNSVDVYGRGAGGIRNHDDLTVKNSTISGNTAAGGGDGGISNFGDAEDPAAAIIGSTISGNAGTGIHNDNKLTVTGSTVRGNAGTGIHNDRATLTVEGSTIAENTAEYYGGGIENDEGTLTVTDSTISGNTAAWGGGGIYSRTSYLTRTTKTTIANSTISGNSVTSTTATGRGGGIYNDLGFTEIKNSTITNNATPSGQGSGVVSYEI